MLLRCTEPFETRESGVPYVFERDTVWQRTGHKVAMGGYELAVMEKVERGQYTDVAEVRTEKLADHFDCIPWDEVTVPWSRVEARDAV